MTSFLTSPRWAILIWQARFRESVYDATRRSYERFLRAIETDAGKRFTAFVDRVSPFSPTGYKRTWARRWLYRLRFPLHSLRLDALHLAERVTRSWPQAWPGRFSGYDAITQMKAEWIVDNLETSEDGGDVTEWIWFGIYRDADVPWSSQPESWLFTCDGHGFYGIEQEPTYLLESRFDQLMREWQGFDTDGEPENGILVDHEWSKA